MHKTIFDKNFERFLECQKYGISYQNNKINYNSNNYNYNSTEVLRTTTIYNDKTVLSDTNDYATGTYKMNNNYR